jgi:pimeloyl-ACP methyl ester carboxylesterase
MMAAEPMPPVRTSHVWCAPAGPWCYDLWGRHGRPVVLIPPVLFERTVWWPAAADLRAHATVLAVDLPGNGQSAPREHYDPGELVDDLACLLHSLDLRQAPVVVGHGSSASLAELFAARYATHAVVTVDAPGTTHPREVGSYLAGLHLDVLPPEYRDLVTPRRDPGLLSAYADCLSPGRPPGTGPGAAPWRHEVHNMGGRLAHLTEITRFVRDIRRLL